MVTGLQHNNVRSIKINYSDDNVSSFGGLALAERLALRVGLWRRLERRLPERRGYYSWFTILKSMIAGLLSGSRGTYATQELRGDEALLNLLGLEGAPEEATLWRALEGLGGDDLREALGETLREWARELLRRAQRPGLLRDGFLPVFGDGTRLEGSRRREGTTFIINVPLHQEGEPEPVQEATRRKTTEEPKVETAGGGY